MLIDKHNNFKILLAFIRSFFTSGLIFDLIKQRMGRMGRDGRVETFRFKGVSLKYAFKQKLYNKT